MFIFFPFPGQVSIYFDPQEVVKVTVPSMFIRCFYICSSVVVATDLSFHSNYIYSFAFVIDVIP